MNLHFSSSYRSENFIIDLAIAKQSVVRFSSVKIEHSQRFESNIGQVENSSSLNGGKSVGYTNFTEERGRAGFYNDASNGILYLP